MTRFTGLRFIHIPIARRLSPHIWNLAVSSTFSRFISPFAIGATEKLNLSCRSFLAIFLFAPP